MLFSTYLSIIFVCFISCKSLCLFAFIQVNYHSKYFNYFCTYRIFFPNLCHSVMLCSYNYLFSKKLQNITNNNKACHMNQRTSLAYMFLHVPKFKATFGYLRIILMVFFHIYSFWRIRLVNKFKRLLFNKIKIIFFSFFSWFWI